MVQIIESLGAPSAVRVRWRRVAFAPQHLGLPATAEKCGASRSWDGCGLEKCGAGRSWDGRAPEDAAPEQVTLHILEVRLHVPFVTGLAAERRPGRIL